MTEALGRAGGTVVLEDDGGLAVTNLVADEIGDIVAANGWVLHELSTQTASLEEAFMELTQDSIDFRGAPTTAGG